VWVVPFVLGDNGETLAWFIDDLRWVDFSIFACINCLWCCHVKTSTWDLSLRGTQRGLPTRRKGSRLAYVTYGH
jgi:hypothetical protein